MLLLEQNQLIYKPMSEKLPNQFILFISDKTCPKEQIQKYELKQDIPIRSQSQILDLIFVKVHNHRQRRLTSQAEITRGWARRSIMRSRPRPCVHLRSCVFLVPSSSLFSSLTAVTWPRPALLLLSRWQCQWQWASLVWAGGRSAELTLDSLRQEEGSSQVGVLRFWSIL